MKHKMHSISREIIDVSRQTWILRLCIFGLVLFAILSGLFYDLYHQELKKNEVLETQIQSLEKRK